MIYDNSTWIDHDALDDPSYVPPSERRHAGQRADGKDDTIPDLAQLLKSQARLAMTLQARVDSTPNMDVKEMKDIATASASLVNGVHRTGELLRALETYKLFHSVVLAFIKSRSDSLGEDLLAELKEVSDAMGVRSQLGKLLG